MASETDDVKKRDKPTAYLQRLAPIAAQDVMMLEAKEAVYRGSWKRRGGVGAFMMLARKWDRIEAAVEATGWDVFAAIEQDASRADGLLDDVRDLRRYLMLVEAELLHRHNGEL